MSVDPPFSSAWHRLARADLHIADCKAQLRKYDAPIAGDEYAIIREAGPRFGYQWHKIQLLEPVPPALNGQVADVLTNLRAALDHAAFAVVKRHAPTYAKPADFPTSSSAAKWHAKIFGNKYRYKQAFPPGIIAVIQSLQPYQGGNCEPLWALHCVRNQSEHRSIVGLYAQTAQDSPSEIAAGGWLPALLTRILAPRIGLGENFFRDRALSLSRGVA